MQKMYFCLSFILNYPDTFFKKNIVAQKAEKAVANLYKMKLLKKKRSYSFSM